MSIGYWCGYMRRRKRTYKEHWFKAGSGDRSLCGRTWPAIKITSVASRVTCKACRKRMLVVALKEDRT